MHKIKKQLKSVGICFQDIPEPPSESNDKIFNKAFDCIRAFELEQMSYSVLSCSVCHEARIDMRYV